ncbi:MAG: helicase [Bacillota bacterium]|nr:helicase [Bacillota bacterium]
MEKINFNINDIKSCAENTETYNRGLEYYRNNNVGNLTITKHFNQEKMSFDSTYSSKIKGNYVSAYDTSVNLDEDGDVNDFDCNCAAFLENSGSCKHIVSLMLKVFYTYNSKLIAFDDGLFKKNIKTPDYNYPLVDLISTFEDKIKESVKNEQKEGTAVLNPVIVISDKSSIGIEFTIGADGSKRNYIVKDVYDLASNIKHSNTLTYGKNLEDFKHEISNFEKSSQPLATFLMNESQIYKQVIEKTLGVYNAYNIKGRSFNIFPFSLDNFFDLFENKTLECQGYKYSYKNITFVNKNPDVEFYIDEKEDKQYYLSSNLNISYMSHSNNHTYLVVEDKFYRCSKEFVNTVLPAVNKISMQSSKAIMLSEEHMGKFCSAVLPQISKHALVKSEIKISDKFNVEPLKTSIYLDTNNKGFIYLNVLFSYGEVEVNPFRKSSKDNTIVRNLIEENRVLIAIENAGFQKSTAKYSMTDENLIYEFLTNKINDLTSLCEVNVSDDFKKINIRYPKSMSMGVKLKSNLIEVNLDKLEFDPSELEDILHAYKLRKKYFRLKDGSFLNLENEYFNTMEKLVEDLNITSEDLELGHIELPKYRSLYLDSLIKNNYWINAQKEHDFKEMIHNIKECDEAELQVPELLNPIMRNYQVAGYKWLKTLSNYTFGGILADDMGLGKTLQAISLLLSEKYTNLTENDNNSSKKPSIVICPTSLVYNWKSEIEKFSPDITTLIIAGTQEQRHELLSSINDYELIFTSYDLIKRDIELYQNYDFKYCILDEAQYIKNSTTQNAKAVKLIKSDVRFALTGTPIENSLSDLWSIFDFIMPGFLLTYKKFKDKYEIPIVKNENKDILKRLHKQIQPFILRRLKKDVLKELPDKIETISYAQMEINQRKLYTAELYKLNQEFKNEMKEKGFEKSQIKILSMLTRLRQICCDPSLCFENYKGSSAKLDLCMEIVMNSIENGHKVLIFSQFTSMLSIIERNLRNNLIKYYLLTGATKSLERLELANKFNSDNTPVFLISLKAGGTGLNLTGADVVIHFDPWWNISAQNQATDRTHRIGQENKVQVFKLIAKDTIEEKIEKLQQSKRDLADSIIKKGEIMINTLSKDEINSLFDV